jgi:hypothetical protein
MIKRPDFAYLKNVTTIGIQDQLTLTDQVSIHNIVLVILQYSRDSHQLLANK